MKPSSTERSVTGANRLHGEAGFVGGTEAMLFGVLVFLVGILLMTNAWAVVDAKMSVSSAARESARVLVESDGDIGAAETAGRVVFVATTDLDPARLTLAGVTGTFERCGRLTVRFEYSLPALSLPFGGGWGAGFEVAATHSEIVDPYRAGLEGVALCDG